MIPRRKLLLCAGAGLTLAGCDQLGSRIGPRRGTSEVMSVNGFLADGDTLFLSGVVDESAPVRFAQLKAANPDLARLVLTEASGVQGNAGALALGRAVRAAGMNTELRNDSVAIGAAVDVFLGGVTRIMQDGAVLRVKGMNLDRNADYRAYLTEMVGPEYAAFIGKDAPRLRARALRLAEIQRYGLISGNVVDAFDAEVQN